MFLARFSQLGSVCLRTGFFVFLACTFSSFFPGLVVSMPVQSIVGLKRFVSEMTRCYVLTVTLNSSVSQLLLCTKLSQSGDKRKVPERRPGI